MEPVSRIELLAAGVQIEPVSRLEKFVAAAAGTYELPADLQPVSRLEYFLSQIAGGGGGGGGGSLTPTIILDYNSESDISDLSLSAVGYSVDMIDGRLYITSTSTTTSDAVNIAFDDLDLTKNYQIHIDGEIVSMPQGISLTNATNAGFISLWVNDLANNYSMMSGVSKNTSNVLLGKFVDPNIEGDNRIFRQPYQTLPLTGPFEMDWYYNANDPSLNMMYNGYSLTGAKGFSNYQYAIQHPFSLHVSYRTSIILDNILIVEYGGLYD